MFCKFLKIIINKLIIYFFIINYVLATEVKMTNLTLIVDDNDKYAQNLKAYLDSIGIVTERARNAKEGYEMYQSKKYHTIITDVTMETQTSGLCFARKVYLEGFSGQIIIATTGFDVPGVMFLGKYLLPFFTGVSWMIPKKPLKQGIVEFHPTYITTRSFPY